ncbi:winged helix-turn-helix domain-containing protein [Tahibacter soli]|uniref:Winged helix-turn-helix domain-containing protein n=1 Tax=Tahibacter soli TaxID=2983605 RepID=A0A9X4BLQ4_9GAMM|nr:winged helix-turn-helix domain-containing protein [Tahibacter soli]MDC8015597.1 winged helix-turn-helix domain-containing protein [Tahibacter soli]
MRSRVHHFGDYQLDPAARELRCAGAFVALPPRAFECLAYLIEQRERAVGRDELIAAVWGKADVSDTLLAQTILRARRAVGDTGNEQHAIRTVPRFGYRWVMPTETLTNDTAPVAETTAPVAPATPVAAEPPAIAAPPRPRRIWPALAAVALIAATSLGIALWPSAAPPPAAAARANAQGAAIVLPVDVEEGPEWAWVRLGVMDFAASRLRARGRAVLPSETTLVLLARRDGTGDALRLAQDSGAPLVLAPRARLIDGRWQVRIDAHAGDAPLQRVEANAANVLDATRLALDQIVGPAHGEAAPDQRAERLQRAEAAMLADNVDAARREIAAIAAPDDDAELIYRRAQIDFRAGDYESLDRRLLPLLDRLDPAREPRLRGFVLNGLGSAAVRRNRMADAQRWYGEAVERLKPLNETRALGQAYTGLGITQAAQRQFDAALATFAQARVTLETAGDALGVARVDANLGIVDVERARYPEAIAALRRAAARFAAFGAVNEQLTTLIGLARAQLESLAPADAMQTADAFWSLAGRSASPPLRHQMAVVRADVLAHCGRLMEARALLGGLMKEIDPTAEADTLARAQAVLARLAFADGDTVEALRLTSAAIETLPGEQFERELAELRRLRLRALLLLERADEARALVVEFTQWAEANGNPSARIYAQLAAAELAWHAGRRDEARAAYEKVLSDAEAANIPIDLAAVVQSYGGALLEAGDRAAAAPVIARVARWADADYGCSMLQVWSYWAQGDERGWQEALEKARRLAGERPIPTALAEPPRPLSSP